jgi:hypothetical protein
MNDTKQYLKTFFEEKEIPFQIFTIHDNHNNVHFIDTNIVIESILSTSPAEQSQIANVLRKIDFKNGSVSHFLKFLAHGMVKQYNKAA